MEMNKNKRATFLVAISYILMKMWMANNLYFIFCIYIDLYPATLLNVFISLDSWVVVCLCACMYVFLWILYMQDQLICK